MVRRNGSHGLVRVKDVSVPCKSKTDEHHKEKIDHLLTKQVHSLLASERYRLPLHSSLRSEGTL